MPSQLPLQSGVPFSKEAAQSAAELGVLRWTFRQRFPVYVLSLRFIHKYVFRAIQHYSH